MGIEIEGTIIIENYKPAHDKKSHFKIESDGQWFQWGADTNRLGKSVEIIEAMANAVAEER